MRYILYGRRGVGHVGADCVIQEREKDAKDPSSNGRVKMI
jgi:hypothetical protein